MASASALPHAVCVELARDAIARGPADFAEAAAVERAMHYRRTLLAPVINATGVLLHSNLGRAPLAFHHQAQAINVELDLTTGERGSRQQAVGGLLATLCGAEAAMVVNNNAAAVLLVLAALAHDRQVLVSRGESVEIQADDLPIVAQGQRIGTVYFMIQEDNIALGLRQPWIKIGTDAGGIDPDSSKGELTHPRTYGTFPRILGKYVRDDKVIPLEDAIRKMSSAVATRLSIQDRGVLRAGMYADIVVFDPATITDKATFEAPHQLSVGMRHVFVNGVAVVKDGVHTGAKPGKIVRGPGYKS